MKALNVSASVLVFSFCIFAFQLKAFSQSDSFTPVEPQVDWVKADRKAMSENLDKLRARIAASKALAARQSEAAQALRRRYNAEVSPPYDSSGRGVAAAIPDPIMVVARQREIAKMREDAQALEVSTKAIESEITDLGWEEVRLARDMRRADAEAAQAVKRRDQAAEDAQKAAERVRQANERALAIRDKQFQDAIETMAVTQSFIGLQSMVNNTNRTLDELERKYDQALLGAYLKDKMTTLLESKAFCSAARNCDPSVTEKKSIRDDMKEVFPWAADPKFNRTPITPSKTTQ